MPHTHPPNLTRWAAGASLQEDHFLQEVERPGSLEDYYLICVSPFMSDGRLRHGCYAYHVVRVFIHAELNLEKPTIRAVCGVKIRGQRSTSGWPERQPNCLKCKKILDREV